MNLIKVKLFSQISRVYSVIPQLFQLLAIKCTFLLVAASLFNRTLQISSVNTVQLMIIERCEDKCMSHTSELWI